ncbi:thioredoxin-like fold domain-containing protein MRL7L homolog, chloroplastic isoform X4 [Dioscorea cayenensis subsp. rotundata]|uniref:Thioredoxin-like fold domain-containing protein MRL7L homolog, chloroplastic isoform X4 n=1 Tax=Dioscorea cayennensis subsp. rotundata TaxID=55577 RepID=A0AB40B503_DIOCR|nr:thioredoxin-like fold domain-containing protein MRL7L homolog, chloroplastic isoform X4 [Dioscorea cayenensis subsp. rotundata]
MAFLNQQLPLKCSMICLKDVQTRIKCSTICFRESKALQRAQSHPLLKLRASKALDLVLGNRSDDDDDDEESSDDDGPFLMSGEERMELRRKIRQVLDLQPEVEEEMDPEKLRMKALKLARDYSLVVDEEDPDWPEDAEGRGFKLDQFFDKFYIKNVKKDDADEDDEEEKEIVWKDDNYIKAVKDITSSEWEDTVFKDFNPLVILVHHRYRRPKENEKARIELEKAVQMFWDTGLPSPRCVAVDAVVEDELASVLKVSKFPEIIFTKAGKILHRDKVVRSGDEIMAFFYYKAVRPACLEKSAGFRLHFKHKMSNLEVWDGTISQKDFYVALRTLVERWKQVNPSLPQWTWIPSKSTLMGSSCKEEGYLSLENMYDIDRNEECLIVDSFSEREETDDVATLVLYWLNSLCSFSLFIAPVMKHIFMISTLYIAFPTRFQFSTSMDTNLMVSL